MKPAWKLFAILLSISAFAADKDKSSFKPNLAETYPTKQTQGKVTIAAVPFVNDDEIRAAFGKSNPYKYGILPVLVVIHNEGSQVLRLDLKAEYVDAQGRHVEAIPASEVPYAAVSPKRNDAGGPIPIPRGPIGPRTKKNPLSSWEVEGRAFSAKMLPAGESANGFVYFQARPEPGASLYVTGLEEASSGKELIYFEIPLDAKE